MTTKKKVVAETVSPEVELLMERLNRLEEELKAAKANVISQSIPVKEEFVDTDDDIDIRPDKYINVMSLCPYRLNLSTGKNNRPPFRFNEFGEVKRIRYADLADIIEYMPHFVTSGRFYIMNRNVIRRHGLDDTYEQLLTQEKINSVFDSNPSKATEVFQSANKTQKDMIIRMLIEKVRDGNGVDMNIVYAISRASGIDISGKAEEAKQYTELQKQVA